MENNTNKYQDQRIKWLEDQSQKLLETTNDNLTEVNQKISEISSKISKIETHLEWLCKYHWLITGGVISAIIVGVINLLF